MSEVAQIGNVEVNVDVEFTQVGGGRLHHRILKSTVLSERIVFFACDVFALLFVLTIFSCQIYKIGAEFCDPERNKSI